MSIEIWDWGLGYIYLWDVLIAGGEPPFIYSYDFRNKSASDLSNDWWTTRWTLSTWSSWVSSPIGADVNLLHSVDLSVAKKITITSSIINNNSQGGKAFIFWLWIDNSSTWYTNAVNFYVVDSSYGWTKVQILQSWTTTNWTNIWYIWTSSYTPIIIIDLENKLITWKINWYSDSTLSLTDSQATAIKSYWCLNLYTTQNNFYIQDVSITVE